MNITGIICEYNPLHLGHEKQLDVIRRSETDGAIVCIMSGNFVQRGKPAVFDKLSRAKAAILCGADLVLELPVTAALSSAEGFAAEGVRLLSGFCNKLCFGTESADTNALFSVARALLSPEFPEALHAQLEKGLSFPVARQAALEALAIQSNILDKPNNILAVEYCKALLSQGSNMEIMPIHRQGSYHDLQADPENPSATAVRELIEQDGNWEPFVPQAARECFKDIPVHTLQAGERAILSRLRTMTDTEFEALPFSSEGLWRKLMHAARLENTLEDILNQVKSKRYTRTRLDRMVMCAFLGLTGQDLVSPAPYARVLALNDTGREVLKLARNVGCYPNIGEKIEHHYQAIEDRSDSLYGLFADTPQAPRPEYRIYYQE